MNNLKLYNKSVSDQCTLNGWKVALGDQGQYTYRHENVVYFIISKIDKKRYKVCIDINGY